MPVPRWKRKAAISQITKVVPTRKAGGPVRQPEWDGTVHDLKALKLTPRQLAERHAQYMSKNRIKVSPSDIEALKQHSTPNRGPRYAESEEQEEESSSSGDDGDDDGQSHFAESPLQAVRGSGQAAPSGQSPAESTRDGLDDDIREFIEHQADGRATPHEKPRLQRRLMDQPGPSHAATSRAEPPGQKRGTATQSVKQKAASTPQKGERHVDNGSADLRKEMQNLERRITDIDTKVALCENHTSRVPKLENRLADCQQQTAQVTELKQTVSDLRDQLKALQTEMKDFMSHATSLMTTMQTQMSRLLTPPGIGPAAKQEATLDPAPSSAGRMRATTQARDMSFGAAPEVTPMQPRPEPAAAHASAVWPPAWPSQPRPAPEPSAEYEDEACLPSYARVAASQSIQDALGRSAAVASSRAGLEDTRGHASETGNRGASQGSPPAPSSRRAGFSPEPRSVPQFLAGPAPQEAAYHGMPSHKESFREPVPPFGRTLRQSTIAFPHLPRSSAATPPSAFNMKPMAAPLGGAPVPVDAKDSMSLYAWAAAGSSK